jgi:chemotaxis-related protein WspB
MLALIFQIGNDRLALDVRHIKEVVPRVPLQTLSCSPSWLAGAFVYHGQVVPVLDLHRLAGLGDCPLLLSSRIIVVPWPGSEEGRLLGLLASQVADLQELQLDGQAPTPFHEGGKPDLGPVVADRDGVLRWLDLDRLLPESARGALLTLTERDTP